jgi:UDP-glucose 4-epimerase
MNKIILTGAKGRIASTLFPFLRKGNAEVIRVSRTRDQDSINYEDAFQSNLFADASVIIHAAWSTVPVTSELQPGNEWVYDLPLLAKILSNIPQKKNKLRQFIFLSSAGTVYGNSLIKPSIETDALMPIGWYGRAKVAGELLCANFRDAFDLPLLVLRVSNPYGFFYKTNHPQGLIQAAVHAANHGTPLNIWGDGLAYKDYLHIDELNNAVNQIISLGVLGTYNLCSGESHSVKCIINAVEKKLKKSIQIQYTASPKWDVTNSRVSNASLLSTTGWKSCMSIDQGIMKCVSDN